MSRPFRFSFRHGTLPVLVTLLAFLLGGCPSGDSPAPQGTEPGAGPEPVSSEAGELSETPAEEPLTPLTASDLTPVLRAVGAEGVVPRQVVVEFSLPVVDREQVGASASDDTVLEVEPAVRGTPRFTGPSTLVLEPADPFEPGTTYQVRLAQVETRSGVVQAPTDQAWVHTFSTPSFELLEVAPVSLDTERKRLEVNLRFSAPVRASQVGDHASFRVNGASVSEVRVRETAQPHVVRAEMKSRVHLEDAELTCRLDSGLAARDHGAHRAPAVVRATTLDIEHPVELHTVLRREGPDGHFFQVVCYDPAAEGSARYWHDEENWDWYRVSSRCLLSDEQAAAAIEVEPEVPVRVVSSRSGFNILGDFERGSYTLTLEAGAVTVDGGQLTSTYSNTFTVPARSPRVNFVSKGRYLPRRAWKNLAIEHVNLPEATLVVRQVRRQNLLFWMTGESEETTPRTSDRILEQPLALGGEPDEETTTWIDLDDYLPERGQGVFEVTVEGGATSDAVRILLTDINLVAKRSSVPSDHPGFPDVHAWALDMHTAEPLRGVEIELVKPSGKVLDRCTTGGGEGCVLSVSELAPDPTEPVALFASTADDFTYLAFSELEVGVSEQRVQGESWFAEAAYRAAPYTDRGVYRPGDTAHFTAIVREESGLAPPAGMPVKVRLLDPWGTPVRERVLETNGGGLVAQDFEFQDFARTGRYRVSLEVGDHEIASHALNVEEFVPERMEVTASSSSTGTLDPSRVPIRVTARYLFGGSASGSEVEARCRLQPSIFRPEKHANFHYGTWYPRTQEPQALSLGSVTGTLDDEGRAVLHCPRLAQDLPFAGAARLEADVAVFEAGSGRTTRGGTTVPVHPEEWYIGLQSGTDQVQAEEPFQVSGVVVDWQGETSDAVSEVSVELFRLEAEYAWWWWENEERYERFLRPVGEGEMTASVSDGRFSFSVTPRTDSEGYLVRVSAGDARTDLQLEGSGRRYWWSPQESRVDQTPRPLRPTTVALETPDIVRVGEEATLTFEAPYAGRALVTLETHEVIAAEWMEVTAGEQTWSFELEDFHPNVYASVFVVKDPYLDSPAAFLPDRAFGVSSMKVEPTAFTHALELEAPEEVRSNSVMEVDLHLGPVPEGTFATVAAVDEGILSLTDFQTPNPHEHIFVKRALGVESFETVGWSFLLPPAGPSAATGGGGPSGSAGRVQPVKPVSLFSGVQSVPESGDLTVRFEVPQYRGALRVMAVTSGPERMGSAEARVLVRDPIVLQTTLPRFLSEGDEAQIPVFVTNLSGRPRDVELSLSAENLPVPGVDSVMDAAPPIEFLGERSATVSLADGGSATAVFQVRTTASVGAARMRVQARSGNLTSYEELDLPLRPRGTRVRKVQRVELAEGEHDLTPYLEGWIPTTERTTFWVTTNPYGEAMSHLEYLVRYPHGCIEQTTSTTRPMLYVRNLLGNVDPSLVATTTIEDRVYQGIERVLSMQTPAGGFAYWPGGTEPNYWGTAYATHFLIDARKAGYDVSEKRLDEALDFVERELRAHADRDDTAHGYAFQYGEPYLHLVLALADRAQKGRIEQLIQEYQGASDGEDRERLYLLKAALHLAGDHRYQSDLQRPDTTPIAEDRRNNRSFYSDLRRRGFALSLFEDLFGPDPAAEPLVQLVADGLATRRSRYYTTQELVWGVTGLGKWLQGSAASFEPPVLRVDGASVEPEPASGTGETPDRKTRDRTWALARVSEAEAVEMEVERVDEGKLYLVMSSEGLREDTPPRYGGSGVSVRREFLTAGGTAMPVTTGEHTLGDMVYVRIRIENTRSEDIPNLVVVDRLPAGWEIENPRLGRGQVPEWVDRDALWQADHLELRDDRVKVFGTLPAREEREVVYAVRAVTSGTFHAPGIEAEAMYDPAVWARRPGTTVTISGPWEDFLL